MRLKTPESQLLTEAIRAFQGETGLQLQPNVELVRANSPGVDAFIRAPFQQELPVVIKRWAQQANIGALVDQIRRLPSKGLLIADYINPSMAEKLRRMDVEYLDAAGNAYINRPPVYVRITGNKYKETASASPKAINRAFDVTGLKLVFGFLCNPLLVEATYRHIAEQTGVALGTVAWVLNDLKETGFVTEPGRGKKRQLSNQRKLLDRWVEAYPEKLRPKLLVGNFTAEEPYWWNKIDITEYGAFWGGEIAAAKYSDYLKPQEVTIYLPEQSGNKLLASAKLKKAKPAEDSNLVQILRPFWPTARSEEWESDEESREYRDTPGLVHPVLVYADLIATGDSRNREAALDIYERHIAHYL